MLPIMKQLLYDSFIGSLLFVINLGFAIGYMLVMLFDMRPWGYLEILSYTLNSLAVVFLWFKLKEINEDIITLERVWMEESK